MAEVEVEVVDLVPAVDVEGRALLKEAADGAEELVLGVEVLLENLESPKTSERNWKERRFNERRWRRS